MSMEFALTKYKLTLISTRRGGRVPISYVFFSVCCSRSRSNLNFALSRHSLCKISYLTGSKLQCQSGLMLINHTVHHAIEQRASNSIKFVRFTDAFFYNILAFALSVSVPFFYYHTHDGLQLLCVLQEWLSCFALKPESSMLDVGCGTGGLHSLLLQVLINTCLSTKRFTSSVHSCLFPYLFYSHVVSTSSVESFYYQIQVVATVLSFEISLSNIQEYNADVTGIDISMLACQETILRSAELGKVKVSIVQRFTMPQCPVWKFG